VWVRRERRKKYALASHWPRFWAAAQARTLGAVLFPLRCALSAACIGVAVMGGWAKADSLPCSVNVFVSDHASCIVRVLSEDIRCRDVASRLDAAHVAKRCTIVVGGSPRATLNIFGEALRSLQRGGFRNVQFPSKFELTAQANIPFAEEFTNARAVVLVRVSASTYPPEGESTYPSDEAGRRDYFSRLMRATAKLRVLHSWKGPYSAGASIAVAMPQLCTGQCFPYRFQVGEKVVVFIWDSAEPIFVPPHLVIDAARVKDAISVLDALAVKTGT
jgi:hypothetical protein